MSPRKALSKTQLAAPQNAEAIQDLVTRYQTDRDALRSFYSVGFTPAFYKRWETFYRSWLDRIASVPFQSLSPTERIDLTLLENLVRHEQFGLAESKRREHQIADLIPFAQSIAELEEARSRVENLNPEATAAELTKMAETVQRLTRAADAPTQDKPPPTRPTPIAALRAAAAVDRLKEVLEKWFAHYNGFQPLFSWWNKKPYDELSAHLTEYAKALREKVAGVFGKDDDPLIGDPIGAEALAEDLRFEMIPYSPEELIAIAEKEFAWCEAEYAKAAREMGKKSWKEALAHVKTLHVPPGEQDRLVAQQAREAIQFVEERDLVTIEDLCRETWRVDMMGIEQQKVLPFAAYGGQKMLVSYPLDSMDHETKTMSLRGNNVHFSRIVTPHELIPGHHLQGYMAERYSRYRRPFGTPFYHEGWCLHWEMLLWDLGYARGPEDRIGMLFWRMHRCARIIVSLKFHLGQMTPAQMIELLVERVGHERWTATNEVRRYVGRDYSPLYQCAYLIGGLQMRALYREWVSSGKMTARQFHDAVLRANSMPLEMLRTLLAQTPIRRPYRASWRFAEAGS
jgi:uncharacterized protein (DUF885 family)